MSSLRRQLLALQRFSELSSESRAFLARAWLAVPVVELSLAVVGVRGTLRWMELLPSAGAARSARTVTSVTEGARLVRAACRRHPLAGACLPQALLQYLLHRRDGVPVRVVIGVRRDDADLDAHAWVEAQRSDAPSAPAEEFAPILVWSSPEARP